MNTTDDFIDLVCKGHVLASTMAVLGLESIDDIPSSLPSTLANESSSRKRAMLNGITEQVIEKFVNIELDHSLIIHEAEALILSPTLGSQNC